VKPSKRRVGSESGGAPLIFVVDDDDSVRRSLARLLESMDYATETFASAEEFLKRERYDGIGCIILDIRMPGMSGLDLQEELNEAGFNMPIVFITGHGNVPISAQAMKKGAVDVLPKPFGEQELMNALNKAIELHRRTKAQPLEARGIATSSSNLSCGFAGPCDT
jgi:two-component system response regulator FixJ